MSLVVFRRQLRPYCVLLFIGWWFSLRVLRTDFSDDLIDSSSKSLLQIILNGLDRLKGILLNYTHGSRIPLSHTLKSPSIGWMFLIVEDIMAISLVSSIWRFGYCFIHFSREEWSTIIFDSIFEWSKQNLVFVKDYLNKYESKTRPDMEKALGKDPNRTILVHLPHEGKPEQELLKEMQRKASLENYTWQEGKVSGTVYSHDDSHTRLMGDVYSAYLWSNPLHAGIWPSINQYEAEVVAMTANLLHGGSTTSRGDDSERNSGAVGCMTSGGTESVVMAIKAHATYYGKHRGIHHPEIICGSTAHASVDKACEMFHIRKVTIDCNNRDSSFTLEPTKVERYITGNTIMIFASAPSYPQGVIDPIEELSNIALRHDIGLHVDACLGGFVLPFAKKLLSVGGRSSPIPKFDFECPGVTSMSIDTHKYGYATKGTSVVLYRDAELRRAQYFSYAQWSGGLYTTPTIPGSRPGALIACAWAAMVSIGESGYTSRVKSLLEASEKIANGINDIPGLCLLHGNQIPTMVVCFGCKKDEKDLDIYRISDLMSHKGWELNSLQNPACVHVCVTLNVCSVAENLLQDLKETVQEVYKEAAAAGGGTKLKKKGSAAIYGMSGSLPAGPVNEVLKCYNDLSLSP